MPGLICFFYLIFLILCSDRASCFSNVASYYTVHDGVIFDKKKGVWFTRKSWRPGPAIGLISSEGELTLS